jgi:nucleoside 2-deoxyribosyltransferase
MKVIYISHPYSAPSYREMRANVHKAAQLAAACMDHGWSFINPIGNSHSVAKHIERTHADWILLDLELIDRSDAVIMAKGWEKSKGCRAEHSYALSKNIKIFYEADGIPSSL